MRVHSCEADFRVVCGIGNCAASFRRYFAYKQHVYRVHRSSAGIAPPTACGLAAENFTFPASPSPPHTSRSSEGADDISDDGPPNAQTTSNDIRKQLVLFYLKITEKLKLVYSTAEEIFAVMRSLFHQLLDVQMQEAVNILQKENVPPSSIEKVQSLLRAENIVEDIFSGLESVHLRKKYVSEHFCYTEVTEVHLQTGNFTDSVSYVQVPNLLSTFLHSEEILGCFVQPM